jgi:hypothetical protein
MLMLFQSMRAIYDRHNFIEINIEIKLLITEMNNTKHPY